MPERLDLTGLPDDPLEALAFLLDVEAQVKGELERAYARTYFEARLGGVIDVAIDLRRHGRKRILAMTRRLNYEGGSSVRWRDSYPGG